MTVKQTIHYICCEPIREGHAAYTHVHEICNELKKLGWKIKIYAPSYDMQRPLPSMGQRLVQITKFLFSTLVNFPKDGIIYIRWHWAASLIAWFAHIYKLKIVIEVNGTYLDLFLSWPITKKIAWFFTLLYNIQLKYAHAIIAVTPKLAEFISKIEPGKNISIISNAANIELFRPHVLTQRNLLTPYVIFFGSFTKWHGIPYLLQSTRSKYWPVEVKLVFLGDGVERAIIEQESLINNKVIYQGVLPYKEVPEFISHALAGIAYTTNLKNRSNTGLSPLKLYEMLACGLPVIIPDHPDLSHTIIAENCGIVVPKDDVEELAKAVLKIWNDAELRNTMASNARRFAVREGSWQARTKTLDQILKKL